MSYAQRLHDTPDYEEPIDTGFTDETITVDCAECGAEATGTNGMLSHILDFHIGYRPEEAVNYAQAWTEAAYKREEKAIREAH